MARLTVVGVFVSSRKVKESLPIPPAIRTNLPTSPKVCSCGDFTRALPFDKLRTSSAEQRDCSIHWGWGSDSLGFSHSSAGSVPVFVGMLLLPVVPQCIMMVRKWLWRSQATNIQFMYWLLYFMMLESSSIMVNFCISINNDIKSFWSF